MKKIFTFFLSFSLVSAIAQNTANSTAFDAWTGFVNTFDMSMNYQWGSPWGVADLKSDIDSTADQITLYPNYNTYANAVNSGNAGDIDYWTNSPDGGTTPGATGNKILEASTFVEPAGYNGQDLTFKGNVVSNDLDNAYTAKYFIKALDPNAGFADALGGAYVMDLPASGEFSVTVTGAELAAGLIVQYGYVVMGVNANPADEATLGKVVIAPSTVGLAENQETTLSIFPNPTTTILNIKNAQNFNSFKILNITGEVVIDGELSNQINVESLGTGVYLLELHNNTESQVIRFIKK